MPAGCDVECPAECNAQKATGISRSDLESQWLRDTGFTSFIVLRRIVFRVVHNERYFDRQSQQWLDGRKTTVDVSFYGPAADGIAKKMNDYPDIFVKGAKVIAFGEVAEPGAYLSDDGQPRSRMAMLGRRIVPDQIANAERALNAQRKDAMQWMTAAPAVTPVAQAAPGQTYVGGFAAPLM